MKKAKHGLRAGEVDTKGANTTDKNGFQACPSMEEVWVHIMSNRHERGCESTINQETQRTVQKETRAPCINEGAEGENHQAAAASSPGEEISRPPDKGALDGNSVRTPSELMEVQELNRRAEEFIRRVNREIRRQTKESLRQRRQRYADHSEPLNHCLLEPPSPAVHGLLVR
ncbi:hypothetical protein KP509_22G008700 [Ceratopteris richardii]|nr:hypothetical protein KP509_22G008700 [Ceratopteris richardii]